MFITDPPEWSPLGQRQNWAFSPSAERVQGGAMRPARPGSMPPGPDLVPTLLAADARHAPREAWLGLALAALMVLMVVQGWLWPLLAAAFLAAPILGIGLESWDYFRARGDKSG